MFFQGSFALHKQTDIFIKQSLMPDLFPATSLSFAVQLWQS